MKEESYKNIFKTTFLFGFVQVFNILIKVITNKIVAVLLGAEGMGIVGIYNNTLEFIKSGTSLGISQSAVRDISEANAKDDDKRFSSTISVTNRVIIITGLLGGIVTLLLSPWLSEWTLGNRDYTFAFMLLSIVVVARILTDGQLAIFGKSKYVGGRGWSCRRGADVLFVWIARCCAVIDYLCFSGIVFL